MEEHLLDDISYTDAAKNACMTNYNFHRSFSMMAGMTANEYIRNRRLSLAGQELQTTGITVIEAAYKYGYESPESFFKAFSRFHGATPRQAKLRGSNKEIIPQTGYMQTDETNYEIYFEKGEEGLFCEL